MQLELLQFTSQFCFGRSTVTSDGDVYHQIHQNAFDRTIASIFRRVPLILHKQRKEPQGYSGNNGDAEADTKFKNTFEKKKSMYSRLEPLQGLVIPRSHGEAMFNGVKLIMADDIKFQGVDESKQEPPGVTPEGLKARLCTAHRERGNFGPTSF
ncbi:hypothetical protein MKZ38_001177 [Zalerion maritima]|uniref:Uncharacterized protein n=1 Tax=Zalerion maritima TaxID=339359 RepID=A0AAD5RZ51_9PEZI|nr:hypothetical protein MKZ38_001177 [Zalerion maritima]